MHSHFREFVIGIEIDGIDDQMKRIREQLRYGRERIDQIWLQEHQSYLAFCNEYQSATNVVINLLERQLELIRQRRVLMTRLRSCREP